MWLSEHLKLGLQGPQNSVPWTPDSVRGRECWVLLDIRVEKLEQLSGQLGLFQVSQMS